MTGSAPSGTGRRQAGESSGPGPAVLDAVVVTYQSRDTIGPCLRALFGIPGLGAVVVVDHGSDGSGDVAAELGARVLCEPGNPGFGAGQNAGRSLTTAPYLLLCNPDAVVEPAAIVDGVTRLAAEPGLAAIQGVIRERDRDIDQRSSWHSVGALHLWARILRLGRLLRMGPIRRTSGRIGLTPRAPAAPHEVEALAAIVLLVRREAMERVGGFDPGYFLYWEDLDLSKRLREAGWTLQVTPDTWAVHSGGASQSDPFERERQWWRGCMRYAALWYSRPDWLAGMAAAAVQWLTMSIRSPRQARALWADLIASPQRIRATERGRLARGSQ